MDLHAFIQEYTDAVYHAGAPEAAARYIADPCIRHEHSHQHVMSLAENKKRIAEFLASASNPRFSYITALAEGEFYASAYEFTVGAGDTAETFSGIEIFRVQDGKITETWNSSAGRGPWG